MTGKKTGGRAAGTPNKITSELREALKAVISRELDTAAATFATLPARDRLELVVKLMPYCMPKIDSINGRYDKDFSDWSD